MSESEEPGGSAPGTEKPKPVRNWRGFLKEYVVVVLGVATALAAQQAVESWREQRQYREAREAMRAELAGNVANFVNRKPISACAARRIAEIGVLLDKAENHQSFDPPSWVGEASSNNSRFSAEGEAARSGLFSTAEQRDFSSAYYFLHAIMLEQDRERQAWARLQALEGRSSLSPEMIANLRQALAEARYLDRRIPVLMGFALAGSRPLDLPHVAARPTSRPATFPLCLPMSTSREEAIRRTVYPGVTAPGPGD